MITCGLCGKEFKDNQIDEYLAHVNECAANKKAESEKKKLEEINNKIAKIKSAKVDYETAYRYYLHLKNEFKENYPDIYEMNFGKEDTLESNIADNSNNNKMNEDKEEDMVNLTPDEFYNMLNLLFGVPSTFKS